MQLRVLNTTTLDFSEINTAKIKYAVLSHRWGPGEVTYKDYRKRRSEIIESAGYEKIVKFCSIAKGNGLAWAWIDTCCIDKRSSAELSALINSMWAIYASSSICFIFLHDLNVPSITPEEGEAALCDCAWFARGWTLQELLAPRKACFLNASWALIGQLSDLRMPGVPSLRKQISETTGVGMSYLPHGSLQRDVQELGIAERMSWASTRKTTRPEDEAYCLLGLLGVNLPLLYGEGARAFRRLQEELIRTSRDTSIFAWSSEITRLRAPDYHDNDARINPFSGRAMESHYNKKTEGRSLLTGNDLDLHLHRLKQQEDIKSRLGILATSPRAFRSSHTVSIGSWPGTEPYAISNMGLRLLSPVTRTDKSQIHYIDLGCWQRGIDGQDRDSFLAIRQLRDHTWVLASAVLDTPPPINLGASVERSAPFLIRL